MTVQLTPDEAPIGVPTLINHQPVIGAIPLPAGSGERCHQWIVMCHNPTAQPGTDYTTWHVGCDTTDHRIFTAVNGNADLSAADAYADLTGRAAEHRPAPKPAPAQPNTDTDQEADHGTEETCDHCNGSGCPFVAATLNLTVQIQVRRAAGPAHSTAEILWALQDAIAAREEIHVDPDTRYAIEHVNYRTPASTTTAR